MHASYWSGASYFYEVSKMKAEDMISEELSEKYRYEPRRVIFEKKALEYPLGRELYEQFNRQRIPTTLTDSLSQVRPVRARNPRQAFLEAKRILVVGIRKDLRFATCKPSADFQLPLVSSCPGLCEYCYLHTTLGPRPYVRVYVNLEEIFKEADSRIDQKAPGLTTFEGSATSDPIPVEKYSASIKKAIEHFAQQEYGRFRFVTKFVDIEHLLDLDHQGHTTWRFSLNTEQIIKRFEAGPPKLLDRLMAAKRVINSNYPIGFLIAPIFIYSDWKEDYRRLLELISQQLPQISPEFELITHRFTARAKKQILQLMPQTTLSLNEEERQFKYGQFGYGKYVYPKEVRQEIEQFFYSEISRLFGDNRIKYLV